MRFAPHATFCCTCDKKVARHRRAFPSTAFHTTVVCCSNPLRANVCAHRPSNRANVLRADRREGGDCGEGARRLKSNERFRNL
jgi:hypothetical protein